MTLTANAPLLRWSSVKTCPRMAAYEAENAPHRDLTETETKRMQRGKEIGYAYVVRLALANGWKVHVASGRDFLLPYPEARADNEDDANAVAEMQVQWALGVGHPDLFIKETETVLEILSSISATPEYIHSKLLQARGYADGLDASSICVAIVDPLTLDEEKVIVTRDSEKWGALTEEMEDRVAQVIRWNETGEAPARVCSKPQESWGRFCTYAGHCFDQPPAYEPAFVEQLQSEEAQQLAIRLAHVKAKRRELSSVDKLAEAEQKAIQAELEAFVPAGKFQVGGYLVTRSDRTKATFKLPLARQDSRIPEALLDEFTSVSRFTVWDVEKTGPAIVLRDSEDEVPF